MITIIQIVTLLVWERQPTWSHCALPHTLSSTCCSVGCVFLQSESFVLTYNISKYNEFLSICNTEGSRWCGLILSYAISFLWQLPYAIYITNMESICQYADNMLYSPQRETSPLVWGLCWTKWQLPYAIYITYMVTICHIHVCPIYGIYADNKLNSPQRETVPLVWGLCWTVRQHRVGL